MPADKLSMPQYEAIALKKQIEQRFPVIEVRLLSSTHSDKKQLSLYHTQRQRTLIIGSPKQLQSVLHAWELSDEMGGAA